MYLTAVAAHLRGSKAFKGRHMRLEASQQDPSRPVLVISPSSPHSPLAHPQPLNPTAAAPPTTSSSPSSGARGFELRLHPCLPPSAFPLAKLAPDRNCVRAVQQAAPRVPTHTVAAGASKPSQSGQQGGSEGAEPQAQLLPTPTYNAGVVADCCVLAHAAVLQRALHGNPRLADGLLLLKVCVGVWLSS